MHLCVLTFSRFVFSSRRRHTRFDCDWSSDVCSSDLMSALSIGKRKRTRALSVPVSACVSQLIAQTCSSGAQSQSSPFCAQTPWPYCVILPAIQLARGNAEITSQTSCVLPMLRVCPPTTIKRQRGDPFVLFTAKLALKFFDARRQFG